MVIKYNKKRFKYYRIWGPIWMLLGVLSVLINPENYLNYGYIIIGLIHFVFYFYEYKKQYLTIEDGIISKNRLFPKRLKLTEVNRIGRHANYYILYANRSDFRIDIDIIDEVSLNDLETCLTQLGV